MKPVMHMLQFRTAGHWRTLLSRLNAVDKTEALRAGLDLIVRKTGERAIRLNAAVGRLKEEWRQWGLEQEERHEIWRRELAVELDAALNKMDFDGAIRRFGFPTSYAMQNGRYIAIWENARVHYTPLVLSPYFLWILPHGFRLRLTFDDSTHLRYWNYQEW